MFPCSCCNDNLLRCFLHLFVCLCRCTVSDASHVERQLRPAAANELGQAFYQKGRGSTLGIAKLRGKGWIASQALAVILYMFNQEVPFPRSASSVCSFRCASVGAINDEYNEVLLSFPMLFTICCLRSAMIWPCDCQKMRA